MYDIEKSTDIALEQLIKPSEGKFRLRADGNYQSYADPASPLGQALQKRGLWQKYLRMEAEVPASLKGLSGAPWTIGYGITGPNIGPDTVWTPAQVETSVRVEARKRIDEVARRATPGSLTTGRLAALASILYNIGPGAAGVKDGLFQLKSQPRASSLWINHQDGNYEAAAAQFDAWKKAGGKVMAGLVTRRNREEAVYRGDYV